MPARDPVVTLEGVWKRYADRDVVRDLSFELRPGELLGFLGPNGAGKTTTMRLILDLVRPDRGRLSVFGLLPGGDQQARIGYLPEERGLYRDSRLVDTLAYLGTLKGLPAGEARRRAAGLLTEVGLGDVLRRKAGELSRGMHQKAQVVAAILHDPELLLIDEPFQSLDPVNAELLREIIRDRTARGAAVLMSTHDMLEAQSLCDRILLIDEGRRLLYGTVGEVRAAFGEGAVVVRGRDVPADAGRYHTVAVASPADGRVRFLLREGATPRDLFAELAALHLEVEHFEVETPTLEEVFLRAVERSRRAA
ncbi:MAG TPA: ATP-binding cassette domain-containing protein [Candidatus Limnocylindrales bacterium]|nr:ATP-binding cassette domain-containing protein [Candidatus Limnocylindrales bacterium]